MQNYEVKVEQISECDECATGITLYDVFKTVPIAKAPGYIAIIYKCPQCKAVGKMAKEEDEWDEIEQDYEERINAANAKVDKEIEIEFGGDWDVDLLKAYWASLSNPPIIEDAKGACKCAECRKKYGI